MTRQFRTSVALLLTALTASLGCHPTQPFYLHEDGDLSHYVDQATDLDYPDVETASLPDAAGSGEPITLSNPEIESFWDLSLEEVVSIALQNSKVIRNLGSVTPFGFADALVGRTASSATVYDPAIAATDIEGALSAFDAQFSITGTGFGGQNGFLSRRDRPENTLGFAGFPTQIQQDQGGLRTSITKRAATGGTFSLSNQTDYDRGNTRGAFQALSSFWTTAFEVRADQPLLRGRGAQVNRIRNPDGSRGVLLARIDTDVTLAKFEELVRNLVLDIENTYWDLYCAYRTLETAKIARDSAQVTWRRINALREGGKDPAQSEAQARDQYFLFRARLEQAHKQLIDTENKLRWLMGLAASDGRLIRPTDEPTMARVEFDWHEIQAEALTRSAELREQKWLIKRAELELIYARNQVLPQLDVGALYRWVGVGDELVNADRNGLDFPAAGSTAWDVMTGGRYQEFGLFFNFQLPVGFRSAMAGVRRAQLALAQSKARLEDMELNTSHLLTASVRELDTDYLLAQTNFNRFVAAKERVRGLEALWEGGEGDRTTIDFLLDAYRSRAEAQIEYYQALCDHAKALALVHYRKGSLLEYNNVYLAEGPWHDKAYWDALGRARQRDASYYFDYGWTRPRVISRGPIQQHRGQPVETLEDQTGPAETVPTPEPEPMPEELAPPGPVTADPSGPALEAPLAETASPPEKKMLDAEAPFAWGNLGLDSPEAAAPANKLRLASYETEETPPSSPRPQVGENLLRRDDAPRGAPSTPAPRRPVQ